MDIKTLSSGQTIYGKSILPAVWIPGAGLATLAVWHGDLHDPGRAAPMAMKVLYAAVFIAGSALILWSCPSLKRVRVDSEQLYISNYRREISIPLGLIADVTRTKWISGSPVTICFTDDTAFGRKVVFIPKRDLRFWRSDPTVAELKRLAGLP